MSFLHDTLTVRNAIFPLKTGEKVGLRERLDQQEYEKCNLLCGNFSSLSINIFHPAKSSCSLNSRFQELFFLCTFLL